MRRAAAHGEMNAMRRHHGERNGFAIRVRECRIAENTRKCAERRRTEKNAMRRHHGGRNGFAIRARDGCIAENTRKCTGRKREEGNHVEPLSVARSGSLAVHASGRNGSRIVGSAAGAVRRSRGREISGGACRFFCTIRRSRCPCRAGGSSSSGRAAGRSAMGRAEADSAAGCVSIRDGFGAAGGFRRAEDGRIARRISAAARARSPR